MNKLLSQQTKLALFFAMLEAKKYKNNSVTLKFLLYGILKANPSLLRYTLKALGKKNKLFSTNIKIILNRCELSFKNQSFEENSLIESSSIISLSNSVRNLLYSLMIDSKTSTNSNGNNNFIPITTLSIFIALLKNNNLKNWLKEEILLF